MIEIYNLVFYQPLFNFLIWLYNIIPGHDIALAIIVLTFAIRVILFPLYYQSIKAQKALQDLQPKIEELKKKYKDNKEKMAQEMMILYKAEKVNPMSSCLPLIIQLPFLIAVYQVFRHGLNSESLDLLYPFVENPGHINSISLLFFNMDLAMPSVVLALLAGLAQFWQTKMLISRKPPLIKGKEIPGSADEKMMSMMNKQMIYFMPFLTVLIGVSLPAGLTLYWFTTTLLMALQQLWMFKKKDKYGVKEEEEQNGDKAKNTIIEINQESSTVKPMEEKDQDSGLKLESGDKEEKL